MFRPEETKREDGQFLCHQIWYRGRESPAAMANYLYSSQAFNKIPGY